MATAMKRYILWDRSIGSADIQNSDLYRKRTVSLRT